MLLQLSQFSPFVPLCLVPLLLPAMSPAQFMSMDCVCKFFGFSIFYVINFPLSICSYQLCFFISAPFHYSPSLSQLITLQMISLFMILFLLFFIIYLFLDREEYWEKERERNINVQLPLMGPPMGTWPESQAYALTGNLVPRLGTQSTELYQSGWFYSCSPCFLSFFF